MQRSARGRGREALSGGAEFGSGRRGLSAGCLNGVMTERGVVGAVEDGRWGGSGLRDVDGSELVEVGEGAARGVAEEEGRARGSAEGGATSARARRDARLSSGRH